MNEININAAAADTPDLDPDYAPRCPLCGAEMNFIPSGAGWDYDRWICIARLPGDWVIPRYCQGEIELETTTYLDE